MRHHVGQLGDELLGFDARDSGDRVDDRLDARLPVGPLGVVILLDVQLDRAHQADDLLFADLGDPRDRVPVG